MGGNGTLQKIAGWMALAVYVLVGIMPCSGLVLCVESDGCVNLEATAVGPSHPCPAQCSPAVGSGGGASREILSSCLCTDIPLLAAPTQVDVKLSPVSLPKLCVAGPPIRQALVPLIACEPLKARGQVLAPTRAFALVQQRTIVLRV